MANQAAARRLLFLVNDASFFVTHRLPLARAAILAGYDAHVALPFAAAAVENQGDLDIIRAAGATLHDLPMHRAGMNILHELSLMARLWRLLLRLRPDILHCITIKPVLYGGAIARLLGIPLVIFAISGLGHIFIAQGARASLVRWLATLAYRFALRNPHGVAIFQNTDDRGLFLARGLLPQQQAVLIPGVGVDTRQFHPAATPPPEPLVALLPARLQHEKGVREFVEAARLLKARGYSVRMALAGYADFDRPGGIAEAELRRWRDYGEVEWWGHCTDMPDTLRRVHIICLPSYREGFSKVLIEAGATGLPVITTNVPGCRDAVRAGETAILVPPRDAHALADAIALLLDDAGLRARMGATGRELAVREYSVENFIAQSLALYDRLNASASRTGLA